MKFGRLTIERRTDEEVRAIKQENIDAIRRGGFRKTADRQQRKLDGKK